MQPEQIDGYAAALFEVARAEGALPVVEEELFKLSDVLAQSDELRSTLTDASLPAEKRQEIMSDLLSQANATPITTTLVSFVVGAGHARELPAIINSLVERGPPAASTRSPRSGRPSPSTTTSVAAWPRRCPRTWARRSRSRSTSTRLSLVDCPPGWETWSSTAPSVTTSTN